MAFKHKRLEHPWQLRLVELLPRTTKNHSETVRCRILLVPGADAGIIDPNYDRSHNAECMPYIALSYWWGRPKPTHKIDIDGMEYEIQDNLFAYLKQRRETPASVMFWIDALCIDQDPNEESTAERSARVTRMTSIYMNADAIEIWLGPEENGSSLAMDELNLLAKTVRDKIAKQHAKDGTNVWRSFLSLNLGMAEDAHELNEDLLAAREPGYLAAEMAMKPFVVKAVFDLWTRPWWGRLWVVQEATVPGSKKVFGSGDRTISWLQLMIATASLSGSFTERLLLIEDVTIMGEGLPLFATTFLGALFMGGNDPMKLLLVQQRRVGKLPLIGLLPMSRSLHATDNRDRIYGLIGMATDVDITQFSVDCSKSVEEVYRELTTYLIRTSPYGNNLDILEEARPGEEGGA
jgi:Heterokaryon incompatibility protein (HET)